MKYFLGLGSNLGDRLKNLYKAIDLLNFLSNKEVSSIYETQAVLPAASQINWNKEFLNLAISGDTSLTIEEVFKFCKNIEQKLGRDFEQPRWSPRIIDIDILLAGELTLDNNEYTVPHKSMLERAFVLIPLCELAPNLQHPRTKKLIKEHLQNLSHTDINNVKKVI